MRKNCFLFLLFLLSALEAVQAQSVLFPDDQKQRGYYDRPYKRYEAEAGKCITNGVILPASFEQSDLQSEASNQVATQLILENSYIQWTNEAEADGMIIRFSMPDNKTGTGTTGHVALYVDGVKQGDIILDSYWAWQYFSGYENVAYNAPVIDNPIIRMRFDETRIKFIEKIPAGATFRLVKTDHNKTPYTIDFVELENVAPIVTFESISDPNKVQYAGNGNDLHAFILKNRGKTIYLPVGKYNVPDKIHINASNTKIIGAGMWYTQIHFTANVDSPTEYNKRGIECNSDSIVLDGLYITTQSNIRYHNRDENKSSGKGLDGSFGVSSTIKNVWIEHFDNGAWIANYTSSIAVADELHIIGCRFRNNYADGTNLCKGSKNCVVEHCTYRNNGDDDMAIWSANGQMCENNVFQYNTAENNWRASSIGIFGGQQNKAQFCVVIDPVEMGLRVDATYPGVPFSKDGFTEFRDISVYNDGTNCDVWRNQHCGAIGISLGGAKYDIENVLFYNIDLINSKQDAVSLNTYGDNPHVINVYMQDINIDGTKAMNTGSGNGFWIEQNMKGILGGSNITFNNVKDQLVVNHASPKMFSLQGKIIK